MPIGTEFKMTLRDKRSSDLQDARVLLPAMRIAAYISQFCQWITFNFHFCEDVLSSPFFSPRHFSCSNGHFHYKNRAIFPSQNFPFLCVKLSFLFMGSAQFFIYFTIFVSTKIGIIWIFDSWKTTEILLLSEGKILP